MYLATRYILYLVLHLHSSGIKSTNSDLHEGGVEAERGILQFRDSGVAFS